MDPHAVLHRGIRKGAFTQAVVLVRLPPCAASHTARTSPPAQQALPPSPTMTMRRTLASEALCSSAGWSGRFIGSVCAVSTLGRASVSHATEPRRSKITSAVVAEAEPHTWRESTPSRVADVLARTAIAC